MEGSILLRLLHLLFLQVPTRLPSSSPTIPHPPASRSQWQLTVPTFPPLSRHVSTTRSRWGCTSVQHKCSLGMTNPLHYTCRGWQNWPIQNLTLRETLPATHAVYCKIWVCNKIILFSSFTNSSLCLNQFNILYAQYAVHPFLVKSVHLSWTMSHSYSFRSLQHGTFIRCRTTLIVATSNKDSMASRPPHSHTVKWHLV